MDLKPTVTSYSKLWKKLAKRLKVERDVSRDTESATALDWSKAYENEQSNRDAWLHLKGQLEACRIDQAEKELLKSLLLQALKNGNHAVLCEAVSPYSSRVLDASKCSCWIAKASKAVDGG